MRQKRGIDIRKQKQPAVRTGKRTEVDRGRQVRAELIYLVRSAAKGAWTACEMHLEVDS